MVLALLMAAAVVSSAGFFYYRDNFSTHFAVKAVSQEAFRSGAIPFWNRAAGGGQPLAGNPNTLTFYPDNLLYLVFPLHVAFNLHFLLHLAWGFLAMRALLRRLGLSELPALYAATLYVSCGPVLSATAFYNLITSVALIPSALVALDRLLDRSDFRSVTILGSCWGLVVLAGEPVMGVGLALLSIAFVWRRLNRRVVVGGLAAVVVAAVVASPLLVAYAEIAGETERGSRSFSTATVLAASVPPWRLAELTIGPAYGLITDLSPTGFRSAAPPLPWQPLFASYFLGALAIAAMVMLFFGRRWPLAAAAAVLLFLALGRYNPLLRSAVDAAESLRVIRYPEKFMLHAAVAATVAVGLLLNEVRHERRRAAGIVTVVFAILSAVVVFALSPHSLWRAMIGAAFAVIAGLLMMRQWKWWREAAVAAMLAPLIMWGAQTILLDGWAPYAAALEQGRSTFGGSTVWSAASAETLPDNARQLYRRRAETLDPLFGAAAGMRYVSDRSPEGMYSLLSRIASERVTHVDRSLQLRYARLNGCDFILSNGRAFRVDGLPEVRPAQRNIAAATVNAAVQAIEAPQFVAEGDVVVPAPGLRSPSRPAVVTQVARLRDGFTFRVRAAEPSVIVANDTWFSAWRVTAGARQLRTFPANIDRLGFEVPAGEWTVSATFGRKRDVVYALLAVSLLIQLFALTSFFSLSRSATADPARYSDPATSTEPAP